MNPSVAFPDYSQVTERPGQRASRLQLEMMRGRYGWAAEYSHAKDVLEVACGAGMGLATLAQVARSVTAGDLDPVNLSEAQAAYPESEPMAGARITLRQLDATRLPFEAATFDVVLMFEALYYVDPPEQFLAEARRVLRPGGHLLIANVNRQWRGFNPSPHSVTYWSAAEFEQKLGEAGFETQVKAGYPEQPSMASHAIAAVRGLAVRLGLIPKTMGGKAFLKRMFYGSLEPVPARLDALSGHPQGLTELSRVEDIAAYRVLYMAAQKR